MRPKNVSLIGLLTIVTCTALAVSHTITSLRLSRANEQLTLLRERLALIDVEDTNLVAARALPSTDPNVFRWTVRLPRGSAFSLRLGLGDVSPDGRAIGEMATLKSFDVMPDADSNEAFIGLTVTEGERGYGAVCLEVPGSKSVVAIAPEIAGLFSGTIEFTQFSIGDKPVTRDADSPIQLFVRRAMKLKNNNSQGLTIWLEPSE